MMPLQAAALEGRLSLSLLVAAPLMYLSSLAALCTSSVFRRDSDREWAITKTAGALAFLCAAYCAIRLLTMDKGIVTVGPPFCRLRADPVGLVMLSLVTFIGWIILRYSQQYLAGDPCRPRFLRALLLTLTAVSCLAVTNNLIIFWVAWVGTSLSLHLLLTLYRYRQAAIIAAHKKFLASRIADTLLLVSIFIIARQTGTLQIDTAMQQIGTMSTLSASLQVAAVLIALSAMIKCAQLPLHGWLIQVMEAPTPVSALLHAGIVNLGGFMLIRFAPLVGSNNAARNLLVISGCSTAVLASLVMMTRISIKVNLAWSTCAQMGFMLMQCGLGLYDLALLHLVAHSLYKAHAFLGSGSTVEVAKLRRMTAPETPPGIFLLLISGAASLFLVWLAAWVWHIRLFESPALTVLAGIVGLAVAPVLVATVGKRSGFYSLLPFATAFGIPLMYFGLHRVFVPMVPWSGRNNALSFALLTFVGSSFLLLFLLQSLLRARPNGVVARNLYPWFYAGLYLDEIFTRLTFRIWPARVADTRKDQRYTYRPLERTNG